MQRFVMFTKRLINCLQLIYCNIITSIFTNAFLKLCYNIIKSNVIIGCDILYNILNNSDGLSNSILPGV